MTGNSTGWLNFERVRDGREPGVREGYSPQDFETMSESELATARPWVLEQARLGSGFEIQALGMLLPEQEAAAMLLELLATDALPVASRVIAAVALVELTDELHPHAFDALLDGLMQASLTPRRQAIQGLSKAQALLSPEQAARVLALAADERDRIDAAQLIGTVLNAASKISYQPMQFGANEKAAARLARIDAGPGRLAAIQDTMDRLI